MLFIAYLKLGIDEIREKLGDSSGVKIHGEKRDVLYFADEVAILAKNETELKRMAGGMDTILPKYNMKINTEKTKILVISRHDTKTDIDMNGHKLDCTKEFTYLGSRITSDG
ncbi:uncharacterized protein LOC142322609 [Lycorma delicatula]|uniref:uncharacterized protein LOC142322609 n=1 Tax=Lycorma delicatula TaxID=130591 RepID=UPI003F5118B6